jgi:hypothetical protein
MSHGHIEFYEAVNAAEKTFVIAFNPSTVHDHTKQTFTFTVAKYPGIGSAEIYRNMNAVVWFECDIAAIAAAEASKSNANTSAEKITHLHEARRARETGKAATTVEEHRVSYNYKEQRLEHHIQELTIAPVLEIPKSGLSLARQNLLGSVNLGKNGYVLVWACSVLSDDEDAPKQIMINEMFTQKGQSYFTMPSAYEPVQSMRFYSVFGGKRLMMDARTLPDNGTSVIEMQYSISIGQDCPDPNKL